ncbi:OprO/OprP family phosphate-selective porin [Polaribacter sp. Z014]|uniref:porin n=1 Tax=Polaribacter sp. Z014 TaxID=2927126 RepID=UPI0020216048|nr:porin [Polaribacter sp. Z014]MCL7764682.1 OprO/OprP family phosphate-selective porin [Polaribacter sp. Z014]
MKKKFLTFAIVVASTIGISAQNSQQDSINNPNYQVNTAQRILNGNINTKGVTVGGYGELTYNRKENSNAELDVQRLVLLFGYKFDDRTQFITEVEFEHVNEVYVEQAFLQYSVSDNVNLRAGLMLVPMGIINEYHEPTTFNGVERPSIDGSIIPTTWRELGVGVSGRYNEASLRYQAYLFNGFSSTTSDGNGNITGGNIGGSNGLRGGRQKGAKSTMNNVNFSGKLDYYGVPGLRLGLSGYAGRTQSPADVEDIDGADVGLAMIGLDARYAYQRFTARGQFIHGSLSDTEAYNNATGSKLGSALQGYYLEAAYNLLPQNKRQQLFGFVRFEDFDTQASVDGTLAKDLSYDRQEWTFGLSYKIAPGAVVKGDYQIKDNAVAGYKSVGQLNFGIGVWF